MNSNLQHYFRRLDNGVDDVCKLTKHFSEDIKLTGFAYIRIYDKGSIGWVTSNSDHDRFVFEAGLPKYDPLIHKAKSIKKGQYLYFHDCEFEGSKSFYEERLKRFHVDHGMVVVNSQSDYIEVGCFSGCLSHRPLYNIFMNEKAIFQEFMKCFKQRLTPRLLYLLEDGVKLTDFEAPASQNDFLNMALSKEIKTSIIASSHEKRFLTLSNREKDCLSLLREGFTYSQIGSHLDLSERTVEHYLESVKNKLNVETRQELFVEADRMLKFGFLN